MTATAATRTRAAEADAAAPLVSARRVVRRYRSGRGVGPVDLDVAPGESVALMGRNGCGKTTLLRVLATLARPQSGTVRWSGLDSGRARAAIGLALDGALEEPGLTGRQATHFWCAQWVSDRDEVVARTGAILERLGLTAAADQAVGSYSFGMRRRLALAAALVHDPALALLDEPTAGLDPEGAEQLSTILAERSANGRGTLIASNDAGFVEDAADRVAFLDDGMVLRCATPRELLAELPSGRVAEVSVRGLVDAAALRAVPGVLEVTPDGATATVRFDDDAAVAALVAAADAPGGRLVGLRLRRPGLADCFRELAGRPLEDADGR